MRANATVSLRLPSPRNLKTILEALEPEAKAPATSRCEVRVEGADTRLMLSFEARDVSALRASMNSYLRAANMLIDLLTLIEGLPW